MRFPKQSKSQVTPCFPIVGIGASAGGLGAFEAFFSAMPVGKDSGMAFILVQHLAPDHKSLLTELIQRCTQMQVFEVEDGMTVLPNHAYVIPPNRDMAFLDGVLQLLEPSAPRGKRLPIDFFFRSLAADQHERAIGIVLSGTGRDGTLGARAIKGEGGMIMVQNPESTEYDGMPRSVISAGLADYVLPPAEMPASLVAFAARAFDNSIRMATPPVTRFDDALKQIIVLLRDHTGQDFSTYKSTMIHRRIERRMAILRLDSMDEYIRCLQQNPAEAELLFNDLLIGVTSFFRDKEAFGILEAKVIPSLFERKTADESIRVWVPGCSTGEEAYSIAILLQERMEALKLNYKLQVFATDIDGKAIEHARSGLYPDSIAADVTPERLARFFVQDMDGGYRVHKTVRDILVFSEQNLIKDPPFSKLDLISCRNLLIYMGAELQKKIIPLFHYALNPQGILFLGISETIGEYLDLFSAMDRQAKLYRRKEESFTPGRSLHTKYIPPIRAAIVMSGGSDLSEDAEKKSLRELTEQGILLHYGASAALVNDRGEIFYLHGRAGRYLELVPGEQRTNNILKMAREGLRRELTAALYSVATRKETVVRKGVRVKTNGACSWVDLTLQPVTDGRFLVIFDKTPKPGPDNSPAISSGDSSEPVRETNLSHIEALKSELLDKDEYLLRTNEELQSVNEELQSNNEEMETSKEELQSVNEELSTVNSELQIKVTDLTRVNNDMNNLLAGAGAGTVFVDHQLRIQRFTPAVTQVINLTLSDVGRPVGHITSNLAGYESLVTDMQRVLDTLAPHELEVRTKSGEWFLLRMSPYRTLENVIEGGVISFINISGKKSTEAMLRETEAKSRVLLETMPQGVVFLTSDGRIVEVNSAATRILGLAGEQIKQRDAFTLFGNARHEDGSDFPGDRQPAMTTQATGQGINGVIVGMQYPQKNGIKWLRVNTVPLFHTGETKPYQVYMTIDENIAEG